MKKFFFFASALLASLSISAEVITLDLTKPTNPKTFTFGENGMWAETYNETEYSYFETQVFGFSHLPSGNSYSGMSWEGFTVSKATQDGQGYGYYSNMAKGGLAGEGTPYIFAYYSEYWLMDEKNEDMMSSNHILFTDGNEYYPRYVYLNNSFVGYTNVMQGGGAARAFKRGDRYEVWIQGLDANYEASEEKVIYRLADFTAEDSTKWFVNTEWEKVDLSPLGKVSGLTFTVVSTDQGQWGTNTATYFALDGLTVTTTADEEVIDPYEVKEPVVATFEDITLAKADTCWQGADAPVVGWNYWTSGTYTFQTYYGGNSGYGDYYAAFTVTNETAGTSTGSTEAYRSAKGGANEGNNFAVWNMNYYGADTITFAAQVVPGFFVNNTAYAVTSMVNGDSFAKKFGAEDYFTLFCIGVKNGAVVDTVAVELASDGAYITEWTYVDLSQLGEIDGLTFGMTSSDTGDWGMNTPAYFAMDDFGAAKPEGYVEPERAKFPEEQGVENTNAAVKAVKVIRNGQVVILRGEKAFNILGAEL